MPELTDRQFQSVIHFFRLSPFYPTLFISLPQSNQHFSSIPISILLKFNPIHNSFPCPSPLPNPDPSLSMQGGDQRISDLRLNLIRSSGKGSLFPHRTLSHHELLSIGGAALLMTKAALACDPFNFAFVIGTGVVQIAIIGFLILLLVQASYAVLLRSWSVGEAYTIADIWRVVIHRGTAWIPVSLVVYSYFSCLIAEFWEITDGIGSIVGWLWPSAPAVITDYWFIQYIVMVLIVGSLLLTTRIRSYLGVSTFGLCCGLVGFGCAVVYFVRHMFNENGYTATSEIVLFQPDFESIYTGIREMSAALFAHPFLPLIASEMRKPSRRRVMKMVWIAMITTAVFVYITPLIGYLLMADVPDGSNFFRELDPAGSPEVIIGQFGVLLLSVSSLVFFTFFVSNLFVAFFHGSRLGSSDEAPSNPATRVFTGLTLCLLAIAINFTTETVELIIYEVAAMAYSVISFILPGTYYLVQFGFRVFYWGVMSVLIVCLGLFLCVLTIIGLVTQLQS
jgi:amino acid permease